jgi:hypothetical protein
MAWFYGLLLFFCFGLGAGSARADSHATQLANLERFERFAGAPVDEFDMWQLYQWQALGPEHLAVWAAVNKVYLLKVAQPCAHLEYANAIRVTSQREHRVTRRLDYVDFDAQHCQIVEIRPVDYRALRHASPAAGP